MSEQAEPAQALEATPEGTPEAPSIDWEKRYNDVRPEYDRTQNELNRYKTDPDFRAQLFQELASEQGYELDTGEQEYEQEEYLDPSEALQRELAELKQWRDGFLEEQQQRQQAAIAEMYSEAKMTELGIGDPSRLEGEAKQIAELQRNWVVTRAFALPSIKDEAGNIVPDVESAYKEFRTLVPQAPPAQPEVPFTPQGGQENTGVPAWSDDPMVRRQQREQMMVTRMQQLMGS